MKELGLDLKETQITQLGRARQVIVQKENTIIVDGAGDKDKLQDRIAIIKKQLEESTSDFDKEKLQELVNIREKYRLLSEVNMDD